jgi:hypothetical protein
MIVIHKIISFSQLKLLTVRIIMCFYPKVKLLSAQGGKDVGDRTRIIMYKLLTNKLMTEFNLEGRGQKQKKAIKDMPQLGSVIFGKIRNLFYFDCPKVQ